MTTRNEHTGLPKKALAVVTSVAMVMGMSNMAAYAGDNDEGTFPLAVALYQADNAEDQAAAEDNTIENEMTVSDKVEAAEEEQATETQPENDPVVTPDPEENQAEEPEAGTDPETTEPEAGTDPETTDPEEGVQAPEATTCAVTYSFGEISGSWNFTDNGEDNEGLAIGDTYAPLDFATYVAPAAGAEVVTSGEYAGCMVTDDTYFMFDGWFMDAELTTPADNELTLNGDVTLYAKLRAYSELDFYIPTWQVNPGYQMPASNPLILEGTAVTLDEVATPTNLSRDGYELIGWSDVYGATDPIDSIVMSHESCTLLYPVWKANTYNVTFQFVCDDDSQDVQDAITTNYVFDADLGALVPAANVPGYTFTGWTVEGSEEPANFAEPCPYDVKYVAHFTKQKFNYDVNIYADGELSSTLVMENAPYGTVPDVSDIATASKDIADMNYVLVGIDAPEAITYAGQAVNLYYELDEIAAGINNTAKGDGISDKYQATVTYKAVLDDQVLETVTETVTLKDGEELSTAGTATLEGYTPADKDGYRGQWLGITPAGQTVGANSNGFELTYKYSKIDSSRHDITCNVVYYKTGLSGKPEPVDTVTLVKEGPVTAMLSLDVDFESDRYPGYKLNRSTYDQGAVLSLNPNEASETHTVSVYYVRDTFAYTVNFLDEATGATLADSIAGTALYEDTVAAADFVTAIDGYVHDGQSADAITINHRERNNVINIYYAADRLGNSGAADGIADKYQVVVTYTAVNGSVTGQAYEVVTLRDGAGNPSVNGVGYLSNIPGFAPNAGYQKGTWGVTGQPTASTVISGATNFVISYQEIPAASDENGTNPNRRPSGGIGNGGTAGGNGTVLEEIYAGANRPAAAVAANATDEEVIDDAIIDENENPLARNAIINDPDVPLATPEEGVLFEAPAITDNPSATIMIGFASLIGCGLVAWFLAGAARRRRNNN